VTDGLAPYRGLTPFGDSDTDALFFFGRDRERELFVANLMASRLTVLYGETGVGKSSILHAGVARDLREVPATAVVVFDSWQDDPVGRLEREIAAAGDVEPAGSLADTIERCTARLDGELYVVLDQLEEYFLYQEGEEGPGTLDLELPEAVRRPGLRVSFLLSLRDDAVARLDRFKGRIPNLLGNTLRLDHLDREAARQAILRPLQRYGELAGPDEEVAIEPELVEAVLEEVAAGRVGLGQSGRGVIESANGDARVETPYLQLVMQRLWEAERSTGSRELRLSTFRALGGAEQIVRDHLERALDKLSPAQKDLAAEMFDHLVTPSGTKIAHAGSDLARYSGVDEASLAPALAALVEERILRPVADEKGTRRYEIYHDVLADPVLAWRAGHEARRELDRQREAAARRHRRLLFLLAVGAVLLAVMAAMTIFAFTQRGEARSQAHRAHARELAERALLQLGVDPQRSLALAAESAKLDPTAQAEDVLRQALIAARLRALLPATGPVRVAAFSADGRLVLVASGDEARLFDVRSHRLKHVLHHGAGVTVAALSSDGRLVLTAGHDATLRLWSTRTGRLVRTLRHKAPITAAGFDQEGKLVFAAGGTGVRIWRAATGDLIGHIRVPPVHLVAMSPNGKRIAVSSAGSAVRSFAVPNGRKLHTFDQPGEVTRVVFDPRGDLLATAGTNGTARIWDLRSGRLAHELVGHANDVLDVEFSPRGDTVVTTSSDGTARVWDTRSGNLVSDFVGHANYVLSAAYSPDGQEIVTTSIDRTARVWLTSSGFPQAVLAGDTGAVTNASFSPDGRLVVTASDDGTARLWDPQGSPELQVLRRLPRPIIHADFSGTKWILVSGGHAYLLDLSARSLRRFPAPGRISAAAIADGGRTIATVSDRTVSISRDGRREARIRTPRAADRVALDPRGTLVAAGGGRTAWIWDVHGKPIRTLTSDRGAVTGLSFSPDGNRLASAWTDGVGRIFETHTGRLERVLRGHQAALTSIRFSADGRRVVTASFDHDARIWDLATSTSRVLHGHFAVVSDASFSPDGRWVVTAGPTTAGVWDAHSGRMLFFLRGHKPKVEAAAFGPDSRLIVTAGDDGTVRTYRCEVCGGIRELLGQASVRLGALGVR
jgi:WD40 repeat protein